MPTLTQLRSEPWWNREIVTDEARWFQHELCRRTGRPLDAFGCKGNTAHLNGGHRSQEWILHSRYCTSRTYTVQSGLTAEQARYNSAIDFTPGSTRAMIEQCNRIYAAMRAGQLEEVREFYGNINGDKIVDGFNNVANRPASADSSHLWHWHIGIDRRLMGSLPTMEKILAVVLGDRPEPTPPATAEEWEDDMDALMRLDGDPAVFLTDGKLAIHVRNEQHLADLQTLHRDGTRRLGNNGEVRVVTNAELIGAILPPVPAGWEEYAREHGDIKE